MFFLEHPIIFAALIAVVAVAFGFNDMARFRLRRVRAIAGVCFAESIRKRILWITPLAIVGVVTVAQLQKATDEQDAIRQTTKYCLFAAGLIVTVAAVILACTNLPKEIENRVIYTIVTKPTTRLEIVLGKVMGFAGVSGMILLIMGGFTWGYLQARSSAMLSRVRDDLAAGNLEPGARATKQHYADAGLLSTKSLEWPREAQVMSRPPDSGGVRWMAGGRNQYFTVPFTLTDDERKALDSLTDPAASGGGMVELAATMRVERHPPGAEEKKDLRDGDYPSELSVTAAPAGPGLPTAAPTTGPAGDVPLIPQVALTLTDGRHNAIGADDFNPERHLPQPAPDVKFADPLKVSVPLKSAKTLEQVFQVIAADKPDKSEGDFYVEVQAVTPTIEYGIDADSVELIVYRGKFPPLHIKPADPSRPGQPAPPKLLARVGRSGMQIRGQADGNGSVAVYTFDNAAVPAARNGKVALQVKVVLERGGDLDPTQFTTSEISVQSRNRGTGFISDPVRVLPETGRLNYVDVPVQSVAGGNFDVFIRGVTPGQSVGLQGPTAATPSVALATADHSFAFNLFKSLLILWMLSVLVVVISVFCSTFLSWPIAVVLTLLLLLGRWGVDELGPALMPGGSRGVATDIFGTGGDAAGNVAITRSLEVLTAVLRNGAKVLPDVAQFPVFEDIERGQSIGAAKLAGAALQTLGYGLPLILLTYLVLKRKEVAP